MTTYTVRTGSQEYADYLVQSGLTLGGLRILDQGDGVVSLDEFAYNALRKQPEDADGCIEETDDGPVMWLQGGRFDVTEQPGPGLPEVGRPVNVRFGDDRLRRVDEWAAERAMSRAEALRHLVDTGLDRA